jgi:nucleoside-diphosphate-sugar epimerase
MKIFLAGGAGVVGRRLVPVLVAAGHQVVATTRSASRTEPLRAMGAEPVILDALDAEAVRKAVADARPEVVVHQMTALASFKDLRDIDGELAVTNRLRTEGTDHLVAAARAAGVRRFVAQSYTGWPNERVGGRVKTEEDPLDPDPPAAMRQTLKSIRRLEATVAGLADMVGVVLRYGSFYGPGTSLGAGGDMLEMVRRRRLPVIGGGAGIWSFIHMDDVAQVTRLAVEGGPAGVYNVVDDDPAEVSVWLPELARAIGAKPPFRLPAWVGRLAIGEAGVSMMTRGRGSSNAKARRTWDWRLVHPSWREGFRRGL